MNNILNLDTFWNSTSRGEGISIFSLEHMIPLGIIICIILLMTICKNKLRNMKTKMTIGRVIAYVLSLQTFFLHFWFFDSGTFTLEESLPLYLCRITSILCIFMILKEDFSLFEIIYFWGLGGATQALLTPDTGGFQSPHWIYIQFFIAHGGILISIFFMMLAYEYRPNLDSLKRTFKYSFIYLIIVFIINYLVGGNYSYLRTKPLTPTIIDYLPIYPYYIPFMVIGMFIIFFVLYIPFMIKDKKSERINKILNT